jgi:hypothetical protein
MNSSRSFPRLRVEALELPDYVIQTLTALRFRSVRDILAFSVPDTSILCGLDNGGPKSIEAALDAPQRRLSFFLQRTPTKKVNSFEEKVKFSCDDDFLQLPTARLRLPVRAAGIVRRLHLTTIENILDYGLANLKQYANISDFTYTHIENAIVDLMHGESLPMSPRYVLHCLGKNMTNMAQQDNEPGLSGKADAKESGTGVVG